MGLTRSSVGSDLATELINTRIENKSEKIIALAGCPNVGKSTLFNTITGLHQHTGNWTGKTVQCAYGTAQSQKNNYTFVDLPGCYSLKTKTPEEDVARHFLTSGIADITIVVCDATTLERNLRFFLQVQEITDKIILCINLIDEAEKMNISIDTKKLSIYLNAPVITTTAHKKECKDIILNTIEKYEKVAHTKYTPPIIYPDYIEAEIRLISKTLTDSPIKKRVKALEDIEIGNSTIKEKTVQHINDDIIYSISKKAKTITNLCITTKNSNVLEKQKKLDRFLTGRFFGFFTMFILLLVVFWITLTGANYPTNLLNNLFNSLENPLYNFLVSIKLPIFMCEMLVYGVYHILTKIISVMLPPMAIFFPMFTILEDIGYLPRIAFNLDKCFQKCSACGKQALTMCMGFGCNAAGVVGSRIIDSQRERLIAITTNSFIPCNGRFPAIISIITMFFIAEESGFISSFLSALILTFFILIGILITMLSSRLLSKTLLKGVPSSFVLELPNYRKPQFFRIIVRSVFDRTLFVLGRAICVAAPAGLLIWLFANIEINNLSILSHISGFLEPLGQLMGLDGIILTAFIFGFPANEIVIPLIFMMYMSQGVVTDISDLNNLKNILVANGWTYVTAINTILFMIMHWPCSTTCLTIKAETKSIKWTIISILLPTLCGIAVCILTNIIL